MSSLSDARKSPFKKLTANAGLVAGKAGVKDLGEVFPGLRVARCEHHHVFCLLREDAPALVVAILHERMDLMARLADRLKP
jgi:plasmid stabilization system protein ParE